MKKTILILAGLYCGATQAQHDQNFGTGFGAPTVNGKGYVDEKVTGEIVFDSSDDKFYGWNGLSWDQLTVVDATASVSGVVTTGAQSFSGVKAFNDGIKPSSVSDTITHFKGWTDVSYNSANFTTDTGTWTVDSGDQKTYAYTIFNGVMTIYFTLDFTSMSSSPTTLNIAIPDSKVCANKVDAAVLVGDNNNNVVDTVAYAQITALGTAINIRKVGHSAFSTSTNSTRITGQISFKIQ